MYFRGDEALLVSVVANWPPGTKRNEQNLGILLSATIGAVAIMSPVTALAKSGGGGGEAATPLRRPARPFIFDQFTSINGTLPAWTGTFTLTNSIPGYYTWCTIQIASRASR